MKISFPGSIAGINKYHDWIVLALITIQATIAAIVATDPLKLNLAPLLISWLAIMNVPIGVLLAHMKPIGENDYLKD